MVTSSLESGTYLMYVSKADSIFCFFSGMASTANLLSWSLAALPSARFCCCSSLNASALSSMAKQLRQPSTAASADSSRYLDPLAGLSSTTF